MASLKLGMSPTLTYMASVAVDKGFSLITIPLLAAYLAPEQFGRLDVAVSLVEAVGLVLGLGMAETLIRFAGMASDEGERRRCIAELMSTGLLIAFGLGVLLQLALPLISSQLNIAASPVALRWALLGATLTALIEMPLVWLRFGGRASAYFTVIAVRSTIQVILVWVALREGMGADGVLMVNGCVMVATATVLATWQVRDSGLALSTDALQRIGRYGVPLMFAALAMFVLGSCNRLFLNGNVSDAEIAHLALATKLALAAPLLFQPFHLWWSPIRLSVLSQAGGLETFARVWGYGFCILVISALGVCLAGPVFIQFTLPKGYAAASYLLPFIVVICVLNEVNSLCNAGTYARTDGLGVLGANLAGAIAALAGYVFLTAPFGVAGVITAMMMGQLVRLGVFLWSGRKLAPVPYPFVAATLVFSVSAAAIAWAPGPSAIIARTAWSVLALTCVCALMVSLRLLHVPERYTPPVLRRQAHARTG